MLAVASDSREGRDIGGKCHRSLKIVSQAWQLYSLLCTLPPFLFLEAAGEETNLTFQCTGKGESRPLPFFQVHGDCNVDKHLVVGSALILLV